MRISPYAACGSPIVPWPLLKALLVVFFSPSMYAEHGGLTL
jgi:hypothetical protein